MGRDRLSTWIFFILCIHLKGYYCLECYNCNTDPIFGVGQPDCVNITNENYLENFTALDPPDDAEVGMWTYCSLRVGQQDGRLTTYRTSQYLFKFHPEGFCEDAENWDGPYTTCYCRNDKCNGGSVGDFRNGGEATTGLPTTKLTTTTAASTASTGGRKGLKCYSCNSDPIIGSPNPECHNITDDKYLEDVLALDPSDDDEFGLWTYCEIRMGQKDGNPWTYRSSRYLSDPRSDGRCEDREDYDGWYKVCYCRSDKCNGGSVDDFGNSGESTTKLATTTAKLTTTPSEGDKRLKCYSCFSNPITELPDLGCNNITDDAYLQDYPVEDPPNNEDFGFWSYCLVTMGSKDGNPWSQRSKTFLYDSRSDGHCEEGENWMGKYRTCYCRSDKCNGGSVDFENIGESTTELPTTKLSSTTIKQKTTTSNGERKELTCYECDTHPVLPSFNPPQPECESNPKEEFIKDVPYYDFEGLKTYCSVQVTLEGGEKRTRRSFSLLNMDPTADGRCDFETNEQGKMTRKICYCRSDACNIQNVTLEHENGPSTTSASPSTGTGATSIISESTQAVITTGSTRATTPTSKTTSKDDDSSGGENGGYHSSGLLDYQVTMLMVHFTLVIVSGSFAAYSVYVVAKHRRAIMESLSYSSVQPCDQKVLPA